MRMTERTDRLVSVFRGPDHYGDTAAIQTIVEEAIGALKLPQEFIRPDDRVVVTPNWVKEHDESHPGPRHWEYIVTHPSVIEAVLRWVAGLLRGRGAIVLCAAPQGDCSFATLREYCGLDAMLARCREDFPTLEIELLDVRTQEARTVDGVVVARTALPGDPAGSTHVRLDDASEFLEYAGLGRLYGASYDMEETNRHHHDTCHDYLFCRTPMDADVFINLPKLKTHKKVGLTCALKNLVGISAEKNWLPHHTEGTPEVGGDQFPRGTARAHLEHYWMGAAKRHLKRRLALARVFVPLKKVGRWVFGDTQRVVRSGNWHGNDTCWRMVLDLNKCLFSFDGAGRPRRRPLRYLAIVDGIVGGEGNGPLSPDPKPCGVIIAGTHPTAVDCAAAKVVDFDWQKLAVLRNCFALRKGNFVTFQYDDIEVASNREEWAGQLRHMPPVVHFRPHFGWVGAIESATAPGARREEE
jgi:uncharacterized protein (DUF362 family)